MQPAGPEPQTEPTPKHSAHSESPGIAVCYSISFMEERGKPSVNRGADLCAVTACLRNSLQER